jgi:hypothetical protein
MNYKNLNVYKVVFNDGTIKSVYGFWASHAWFIADQLFPDKTIQGVELESSHIETHEIQAPAA